MKISFYIQPGARTSEFCGRHDGVIKIKLKSPPTDGQANAELLRFLSEWFELPKNKITLVSGSKSRKKTIQIDQLSEIQKQKINSLLESI